MKRLDENGHEIMDQRPAAIPLGFRRPPSITEQLRAMVRTELSMRAAQKGHETFEEADDFVTDEDPELRSPYELDDEQMSYTEKSEEQVKPPEDKKVDTPPVKEAEEAKLPA